MALKLIWTSDASLMLQDIRDYYIEHGGLQVVRQRINKIRDCAKRLKDFPELGKKEEALSNMTHSYRSLIEGDYKIIYYHEESVIYIIAIFDCRQDDVRLRRFLK